MNLLRKFALAAAATVGLATATAATPAHAAISQSDFANNISGSDLALWNNLTDDQRAHAADVLDTPDPTTDPSVTLAVSEDGAIDNSFVSPDSTVTYWHSYTTKYKIFGITYASVKEKLWFQVNLGDITRTTDCIASYTNYVPLRTYVAQVHRQVLNSNAAECIVTWEITKAGWWTRTGDQGMIVNARNVVTSYWAP